MGNTEVDLVRELEARPQSERRDMVIERARHGYYHDFHTALAAPKMTLHRDLIYAGFTDLAERVREGAWDEEHITDPKPPPPPFEPSPEITVPDTISEREGRAAAREVDLPSEVVPLAIKPSPPSSSETSVEALKRAYSKYETTTLVGLLDSSRKTYHDLAAATRGALRNVDAIEQVLKNREEVEE